ncbi:MAG: SUMF1/EgtB/PvdO family nonheme iron enzyme, partial [Planctomycetaceae bacterium]
ISHHETLSCPDTMSIAFWLRRGHAYNRAEIPIIEKQGSFTVAIVGAKQTEESKVRLICRIAGSDNETVIASSRSIRRAWQHVALTHDGTQLTLYINGQPNNTVPITHGIATTSSDLVLGNSGNRDLSGDIDEVSLYNRALTERDVISLTRSRPAPAMAVAPFDSAEAMAFQSAWSEHLELPVEFTNNVGITMRLIPPGEFQMGVRDSDIETLIGWHAKKKKTRDSYKAELPRHTVRISQPFYLGVHEVTQQEYHAVTGEMPAFFPSETTVKYLGDLTNDEFPVERISWNDCVEFCNQLAASNGSPPCYEQSDDSWVRLDNPGYRLPTEAEWEYSCRAGTESMWSYGERYSDYESSEWAVPNSEATTRPVGQLQPNAFGLFDMHGNVFEWCQDWFKPKEYKTRSDLPAVDPTGPESGTRRVYRGGSWWQRRTQSRSSFRGSHFPGFSYKEHGFRIVLDVSAARVVTESKTIAAVRKWAGK